MSTEVIITIVGLTVAGLAAVVGIWVERDEKKPPRYAYALSALILLATVTSMYQTYSDSLQGEKLEADMARMLQTLDKLAAASDGDNPELDAFVKNEIAAQSRANPSVVEKLAQRVSDEGGDAAAVLARNLPASEVESMQRKGGLDLKPTTVVPKPTIALGGAGEDGKKRGGLRLMPKKGDGDDDPSVAAAGPDGDDEAKEDDGPKPQVDAKALAGKGRLTLGGAKSDDAAKSGDAPKGGGLVGAKPAAPAAAPADAPKPKLKPRL